MLDQKFNESKIHYRGKFIVIDGCEGAGKTSALRALVGALPEATFITTHEPGGTPYATKIRELVLSQEAKEAPPETQFGLMWGARADHLKHKIGPALESGISVISDRFDSSTFAYQVYAGDAKYLEDLFWKTREVYLRTVRPDLYIFFDVVPEEGLRRVALRKEITTHFDERRLEFHKKVRLGFMEFLKHVPHVVIDANKSITEVNKNFLKIVEDTWNAS